MTYMFGWNRILIISFYLTFANFLGWSLGGDNLFFVMPLLMVVSFALASFEKYNKNGTFLLLLLPISFLIVPFQLVNVIILLPALLYFVVDVFVRKKGKALSPNYGTWFYSYIALFLVLTLAMSLAGIGDVVDAMMIPFGLVFFVSIVILMRSIRHSEQVLEDRAFHWINALGAILVIVGGLLLNSPLAWGIYAFVLGGVALLIVVPALTTIYRALSAVGIAFLTLIGIEGRSGVEQEGESGGVVDWPETFYDVEVVQLLSVRVLLVALLVAVVLFFFIRFVRSIHVHLAKFITTDEEEIRRGLDTDQRAHPKKRKKTGNPIREIYYDYLQGCKKRGVPIKPYMTSQDIHLATKERVDSDQSEELRLLYIKSRYGEVPVHRQEVKRAKRLVREFTRGMKES